MLRCDGCFRGAPYLVPVQSVTVAHLPPGCGQAPIVFLCGWCCGDPAPAPAAI